MTGSLPDWRAWERAALLIVSALYAGQVRTVPDPMTFPPCGEADPEVETRRIEEIAMDLELV